MNNANNNQRDPRWANILIGNGTIGIYGCLVSVIGDAIGTTPDVVVARLKAYNGLTGNNVIWNLPDGTKPIEQAFPGIVVTRMWIYDNAAVAQALALGNRVIVEVPAAPIGGTGSHWVEYIGNQQLKDPWTSTIRPTNDFPNPTGYAIISGTWQQATAPINTEGLNTHGLDPANEQSNQVVFDTWEKVKDGLYIPVSQFQAAQQQIEDLQKQILDLQSTHNEDQKEIVNLNSSLTSLSSSNKDYTSQAMDAENIAATYTNYMNTIAEKIGIMDQNQTDQELHDEIIREIIALQQNQKTTETVPSPQEAQDIWEASLKSIVNWLLAHGFTDFLKQNNLHVIDSAGNFVDESVADKVITYLDDRFHRLDILEQAQQAVSTLKSQVGKSSTLFAQIVGIFWTPKPKLDV